MFDALRPRRLGLGNYDLINFNYMNIQMRMGTGEAVDVQAYECTIVRGLKSE